MRGVVSGRGAAPASNNKQATGKNHRKNCDANTSILSLARGLLLTHLRLIFSHLSGQELKPLREMMVHLGMISHRSCHVFKFLSHAFIFDRIELFGILTCEVPAVARRSERNPLACTLIPVKIGGTSNFLQLDRRK